MQYHNVKIKMIAPVVGIILTVALYALPYVALPIDLGASYRGIFMHTTADADPYVGRIEEARNGRLFANEILVHEYQDAPLSRMPKVGETALGLLARVLGTHAPLFVAITTPIFAAGIFLLWYLLGLRVSRSRLGALFIGFLAVGGVPLLQLLAQINFGEIARTLAWRASGAEFLLYTRPVNPNFSGLFWSAFLLAACWCFGERTRSSFVITSILAAALAYFYDPYWVYAMVFLVLLFAMVAVQDRAHRQYVVAGLALSLAVAAPVIADAARALGRTAIACYGSGVPMLSHTPIIEKFTLAILLLWIIGYRLLVTRFGRAYWFVLAGLATSLIVVNQQIVTGRAVQPHHFYFFTNTPFAAFAFGLLALWCAERLRRPRLLLVLGSVAVALFALGSQVSSYRNVREAVVDLQRYGPAFAWLNANTKPGDVVLADPKIGDLLPVYTRNDAYLGEHAAVSCVVPQERLEHNFFALMRLEGVYPDDAPTYLRANRDRVGVLIFEGQYWREQCDSYGCFPDSILDDLAIKYQTANLAPLEDYLQTARLDYALVDQRRHPSWDSALAMTPVWSEDDILIYAFAH